MAAQVVFIIPSVGSKERIDEAISYVRGLPRIVRNIAEVAKIRSGTAYVATDSDQVLTICKEYGIKAYRTYEDISNDLSATEEIVKRLECINVIDDKTLIVRIDPTCKWVTDQVIQELIRFQVAGELKNYACVGVEVSKLEEEVDRSIIKVLVGENLEPLVYSYNPIRVNYSAHDFHNNVASYVTLIGIDAFSRITLTKMFESTNSWHPLRQAKDAEITVKVMSWRGMPPMFYDDQFTLKRLKGLAEKSGDVELIGYGKLKVA